MADVFVTLSAPWKDHQVGDKVRVTEVEGRQLRRGGIAVADSKPAPVKNTAKRPAKAVHKSQAAKVSDEKPSGDGAGS
jgi:hypothetical protein